MGGMGVICRVAVGGMHVFYGLNLRHKFSHLNSFETSYCTVKTFFLFFHECNIKCYVRLEYNVSHFGGFWRPISIIYYCYYNVTLRDKISKQSLDS